MLSVAVSLGKVHADDREKVLFDTDIGGDPDDLIALTYLLSKPECDLVGVTVVGSENDIVCRAEIVSSVCSKMGRADVPVHVGLSQPILYGRCPIPDAELHYPNIADECSHKHFERQCTAIDFMRRVIRDNDGDVTLLAVGSFSNVGALFASDPDVPRHLKRLVLMGGKTNGKVEWNAACDPIATAISFLNGCQSRPQETIALCADVTRTHHLAPSLARHYLSNPGFGLCLKAAEAWFRAGYDLFFHDPIAAVAVFHPEVLTTRQGTVTVDIADRGRIRVDDPMNSSHGMMKIATAVDFDAFDKELKGVVTSVATKAR